MCACPRLQCLKCMRYSCYEQWGGSTGNSPRNIRDIITLIAIAVRQGREDNWSQFPLIWHLYRQWSSGPQAGFSSNASTWLPVNPDYTTVNVETESKDPTSPLEIMKATLAFRKSQSDLALGRITQVPDISGDLFDDLIVVKYLMGASVSATVANWNTSKSIEFDLMALLQGSDGALRFSTDPSRPQGSKVSKSIKLAPGEVVVVSPSPFFSVAPWPLCSTCCLQLAEDEPEQRPLSTHCLARADACGDRRSKQVADFLLMSIRELLPQRQGQPESKVITIGCVILMSATMQHETFRRYFPGCAEVSIEGRVPALDRKFPGNFLWCQWKF
ncbi:putative oligo-1,6-glucosidase 2 [Symbiodinium microadriaticum]|uniref:Putative oligo-1,6-glucosidase 2 n=1 Tax=Symbiodinium microadriaticum TaxID=2951 RepID=A0A1Q9CPI7_SYMMI|nr:putative oligo-1,6-glucosidase 2 [Symbiodinium microadriaticum]